MTGATEAFQKKLDTLQTLQHEKESEREFHRMRTAQLDDEIIRLRLDYARTFNEQLPVTSLPREILLSIFKLTDAGKFEPSCAKFSNPDEDDLHYCHASRVFDNECVCRRKAELDISQVCHSWRTLALGCSELWTTFSYIGHEWAFSNLRLPLYLERSRQRLLDLRLYFPKDYSYQISAIVNMVHPHASRWRLLCLRFDRGKDQRAFLESIMVAGPISPKNLEVYEIFKPGDFIQLSASPDDEMIFKYRAAPKLTWLRMRALGYDSFFPLSSHTIAFLQIDKVDYMEVEEFQNILQLPALVSLSLSDAEIGVFDTPSRPVIAPKLRYLRYQSPDLMFCLWKFLEAPFLELLILKDATIGMTYQESFKPVGPRGCDPFPSLRTVGLINCNVSSSNDDFLLHLARATPGVTRLMLLNTEDTYELLGVLPHVLEHGDVVYWPNLTIAFCSDKMAGRSDIDAIRTRLAEMLIHQATKLQKHCTYQICNPNLNVVNDEEWDFGGRWKSIQKGEFYEIICSDNTQEVPEWCSWPPQLRTEFYYSPEADLDPDFEITDDEGGW
ncbi:hypothetical protein HYPSUDRAFT_42420 [Hypholoma sublateritium FD-334 SS-4]|uniref:F-box domain-containing protein n=1 Tax=Hypholoma sublateritium (strain FD-334 SS-4) TaxID=945553 RepID=A0A0D2NQH4_HYPSF|nr:hypothetical protein HYPSUDRAFT_42420 [Hypholoma sublateritium FD-334 SS-4]